MALTKKQVEIIDALQNGGHIWKAANTYYIARVVGENQHGHRVFKSDLLPKKTFDALMEKDMLEPEYVKGSSFSIAKKKWRLK